MTFGSVSTEPATIPSFPLDQNFHYIVHPDFLRFLYMALDYHRLHLVFCLFWIEFKVHGIYYIAIPAVRSATDPFCIAAID